MISPSLVSPLSAAAAAPRAVARSDAPWRERLDAFVGRWRTRRASRAEGRALDALAGLSAHLLRDIGAPDELIARHVEEIEPRGTLADLEVRG
jgi:hypothetical protein